MKSWLLTNKNSIPFFALFLLTHMVNRFGDLTGQYAKIEVAIYLIYIYIPIYIYNIRKIKVTDINFGTVLLLVAPIVFEFIINEFHQNRTNIAYYDLSVMAVSTIFLLYFLAIDEPLERKNILLRNLIFIIAFIIIITSLINIIFNIDDINQNKGRFITGNQNISAYILMISLPFLLTFNINNYYKIAYVTLIILVTGLLFKARAPTIISITYGFYLIYKIINIRNIKFLIIAGSCAAILVISFFLIFNNRFYNLFSYDIYYRLLPILRLYLGLGVNDLIFGVGTGNFAALLYSMQNIYPALEVMLPTEALTYAHNFIIDRFVSAGIFIFVFYFVFYIAIFIKYMTMRDKNIFIKALFHAFFIGLLMSLYDIVHNSISGYSIFTLVTGLLILNLFNFKIKYIKIFYVLSFTILIIPVIQFMNKGNMGHHYEYNKIINLINLGKITNKEINNFYISYPHYSEIDTLNVYYKYFHEPSKLNESDFKDSFFNMNKYNRYRNARLHFSSQYYSLRNLDDDLVNVYADILFRSVILKKIVTPTYVREQIKVENTSDGNPNIKFISKPCCTLNIPQDMFKQLKYVNSGLTNLKITEESINFVATNTIYSIDSRDSARDTDVVKEFLREINKFSEPLKF